jgi:hypothetical protein
MKIYLFGGNLGVMACVMAWRRLWLANAHAW